MKRVLFYTGWLDSYQGIYDNNIIINSITSNYDLIILGSDYQKVSHPSYANTNFIISGLLGNGVEVYGGIDATININQLQVDINEWKTLKVTGILIDNFGFDSGITRQHQINIVNYIHSVALNYIANSRYEFVFFDDISQVPSTDLIIYNQFIASNANNLSLNRTNKDSLIFMGFGINQLGATNYTDFLIHALNINNNNAQSMQLLAYSQLPELANNTIDTTKLTPFSTAQQWADYCINAAYAYVFNGYGINVSSLGILGSNSIGTVHNSVTLNNSNTEIGLIYETQTVVSNFVDKQLFIGMNPHYYSVEPARDYNSFYGANEYSVNSRGIIGNNLKGSWRPFSINSLYNLPIPNIPDVVFSSTQLSGVYPNFTSFVDSNFFSDYFLHIEKTVRFVRSYTPSIWVIDSDKVSLSKVYRKKGISSGGNDDWVISLDPLKAFDKVALDNGYLTYAQYVPVLEEMWSEGTHDGHMIIIDPFKNVLWEMSRFNWVQLGNNTIPECSTYNIWRLKNTATDLNIKKGELVNNKSIPIGNNGGIIEFNQYDSGKGVAVVELDKRWTARGSRGGGATSIAGMIRPNEIETALKDTNGYIHHALTFTIDSIRNGKKVNGLPTKIFDENLCARSDGQGGTNLTLAEQEKIPYYGMRVQLDPTLTEVDFDNLGLTKECKIVARTLQKYGMILSDSGGDFAIDIQLLNSNAEKHWDEWEKKFPLIYKSSSDIKIGLFDNLGNISAKYLRVINLGVSLAGYDEATNLKVF